MLVLLRSWLPYAALIAGVADPLAPAATAQTEEVEEEVLRERLTERVDKRRPLEPNTIDIAGRPLTVTGEFEVEFDYERDAARTPQPGAQLFLTTGPEVEAFYTFGPRLSLFGQVQFGRQAQLQGDSASDTSGVFFERGETWLYSENVAGLPLSIEIGRLNFEDDRRWWWDANLDAVRAILEVGSFELALALAREVAPSRSGHDYIEPDADGVARFIAESSWDWHPEHALTLFLLHQDDRSHTEREGEVVDPARTDASDARLTWIGMRLNGATVLQGGHVVGYWVDAAGVQGEEQIVEYSDASPTGSVVDGSTRAGIRGWGVDAGFGWIMPLAFEPRLYAGYAVGSGDSTVQGSEDRRFRQTGIQTNEAGFGGAERFNSYGLLLDPELSNLSVVTAGAGISLLHSSSLDLVYHHYRLVEPATALRNARIETPLDGRSRALGEEVDVVLAVEEWERFEVQVQASAFRAGEAFGAKAGDWSYGGFVALRIAF